MSRAGRGIGRVTGGSLVQGVQRIYSLSVQGDGTNDILMVLRKGTIDGRILTQVGVVGGDFNSRDHAFPVSAESEDIYVELSAPGYGEIEVDDFTGIVKPSVDLPANVTVLNATGKALPALIDVVAL